LCVRIFLIKNDFLSEIWYILVRGFFMARKEFCEKDGIYISYTNNDVCFEDLTTAESILLSNNGEIIHSNFDDTKNEYFKNYLKQIYPAIISFRNFDEVETA